MTYLHPVPLQSPLRNTLLILSLQECHQRIKKILFTGLSYNLFLRSWNPRNLWDYLNRVLQQRLHAQQNYQKGGHLADLAFETSSCFEAKIQGLWRQHFQNLKERDAEAKKRKEAAQRLTAFVRAKMEPKLKPRVLAEFPSSGSAVVLVKGIKPVIGFHPKPRPSDSSRSSSEDSYPDFKC